MLVGPPKCHTKEEKERGEEQEEGLFCPYTRSLLTL
jgi:hypothetical protein